jgi:hypothetical protein
VDDHVFDSLARRLGAARSRREALATVGSGALAAVLVGLGLRDAAAQELDAAACKGHLEKCKSDSDCCGGKDPSNDITCDRVSRKCKKNLRRKRCVGDRGAKCADDCDCKRGLRCKGTTCR